MKENITEFLTDVEIACRRIRGLGDVLDCIASSDFVGGEFENMFSLFADECFLIGKMIDQNKLDN